MSKPAIDSHKPVRRNLEEAKETILKEEIAQEERLTKTTQSTPEQLVQRQLQRETQQIENKKRQSSL